VRTTCPSMCGVCTSTTPLPAVASSPRPLSSQTSPKNKNETATGTQDSNPGAPSRGTTTAASAATVLDSGSKKGAGTPSGTSTFNTPPPTEDPAASGSDAATTTGYITLPISAAFLIASVAVLCRARAYSQQAAQKHPNHRRPNRAQHARGGDSEGDDTYAEVDTGHTPAPGGNGTGAYNLVLSPGHAAYGNAAPLNRAYDTTVSAAMSSPYDTYANPDSNTRV
jgi:hypothetical protein